MDPLGPGLVVPLKIRRTDSDDAALELSSLSLAQSTPDAESLVVRQRVLKAFRPDLTAGADALRLTGRSPLLRKEGFRIGLCAQAAFLPLRSVTGEQIGNYVH
jgi:hypothetical protein